MKSFLDMIRSNVLFRMAILIAAVLVVAVIATPAPLRQSLVLKFLASPVGFLAPTLLLALGVGLVAGWVKYSWREAGAWALWMWVFSSVCVVGVIVLRALVGHN